MRPLACEGTRGILAGFLLLFGIELGLACDKTAEVACATATCPFPTTLVLMAGSDSSCGGSRDILGGQVQCFTSGSCSYACRSPVRCCGGLSFTRDSFACETPCADQDDVGSAGGGLAGSGSAGTRGGAADGSAAADPSIVGCADGTREALSDLATFPTIAGCQAPTAGDVHLRAPRTGSACGWSSTTQPFPYCTAAEDACASGWYICARNGHAADIMRRLPDPSTCGSAVAGDFFMGAANLSATTTTDCGSVLACDDNGQTSDGYVIGCGAGASRHPACPVYYYSSYGPGYCSRASPSFAGPAASGVLCCKPPAIEGPP